jgi:preprotein translocase subunit YajC
MLISNAYAQSVATADPTGGMMQLLPMLVMFAALYFIMIRPQMKKAKEHRAMVDALAKGDEIVTQGGIAGRVVEVGENYFQVSIANNVNVAVQKQAVAAVLPKGTLKSL